MKKLLSGAVVAVLLLAAQAAAAADIGLGLPSTGSPPPLFSYWTGAYIGIHGGWGWTTTHGLNAQGLFGGGQIGYNYEISPHFVVGLEGDGAFANVNESFTGGALGTPVSNATFKDDGLASIRGRFGIAFTNILFYGTAGGGWGHSEISGITALGTALSERAWQSGWSAGAGIEYAFVPNWSIKLEYLHYGLGSANLPGLLTTGNLDVETVKVGVNYLFH